MNKKILAIGATSAVAAAMPVLGVFAATTRTDTLNVSVEKGCTFSASSSEDGAKDLTMAVKSVLTDIEGVTFNVQCSSDNESGTWKIQAAGLHGSTDLVSGENKIATGTTLTGSGTSAWGFKVATTGAAKASGSYGDYAAVPATATDVATQSGATANADATVQAYYAVSIGDTQPEGTYTGGVTYTLTNEGA